MTGWQMTLPALVTIFLGFALGHYYLVAQLPVKRLMSNAKSPVIGHVQSALIGLGKFLISLKVLACLSKRLSLCPRLWIPEFTPDGID